MGHLPEVLALAAAWCAVAVPFIVALIVFNVMDAEQLLWSSVAVAPVALGLALGRALRAHINERMFTNAGRGVRLFTGITLLRRSLL